MFYRTISESAFSFSEFHIQLTGSPRVSLSAKLLISFDAIIPFLGPGHHSPGPSSRLTMAIVLLPDFLPLPSMIFFPTYIPKSSSAIMLKMDQNEIMLWDKYPFCLKDK